MNGLPVSLTSDLWTSTANDGYISLTGHYIDQNWKLCAKTLASRRMEDRHTGKNIAQAINEIRQDFKIGKVGCLVTDNAANMSVAAKEANFDHAGCFAHTLQLCVEDGLKMPAIDKALGAGRKLVSHFNKSVISTQALLEKQRSEGQKPLKVIQDVSTRWNSAYLMMERLLSLRIPIYSVLYDKQCTSASDRSILDIKDCHWKVMETIVPVLQPLFEATELLGKENVPTGSAIYILVQDLVANHLEASDIDTVVARDLKKAIKKGIMTRFFVNENGTPLDKILKSPLIISTALDPRFKQLKIMTNTQRDIVKQKISDLLHEIKSDSNDGEQAPVEVKIEPGTEDPAPKKPKLFASLLGDICDLTLPTSLDKEYSDFLEEPVRIADPLEWWQSGEFRYPNVAKLAKVYLAIPATSVPSERTFSIAGMTMTKLRSSLDPDTLDEIIFINKNMKESDTYSAAASLELNPLNQDPSTNSGTTLDTADKNEATIADHDQIKKEVTQPTHQPPLPSLPDF